VTVDLSSAPPPLRNADNKPDAFKDEAPNDYGVIDPALNTPASPQCQGGKVSSQQSLEPSSTVQILDLYTDNPMISYHGTTFSCHWASGLGTELFLAKPDTAAGVEPLLREKGFDLVAAARLKLVGRPARLIPKTMPDSDDVSPVLHQANEPPSLADAARKSHGEFLKRLASAKLARGENDQLSRRLQRMMGVQISMSSNLADLTFLHHNGASARGAGQRRRRGQKAGVGKLYQDGGLFRDFGYDPDATNTGVEGKVEAAMDAVDVSTVDSTPVTWAERLIARTSTAPARWGREEGFEANGGTTNAIYHLVNKQALSTCLSHRPEPQI